MAQLQENAALLSNDDVFDNGIRAVTSYDVTGGTVILAATGIGGGLSSYLLSDNGSVTLLDLEAYSSDNFSAAHGGLSLEVIDGGDTVLIGGLEAGVLQSYVMTSSGQIGSGDAISVAGNGSYSAVVETDSGAILTANQQGSGVLTYTQAGNSNLTLQHTENDTGSAHASAVVDVKSVVLNNGTEVILTASQSEYGVSSYVMNGYNPAFVDSVGPDSGLGIMIPNDMAVISMGAETYVIVASAPSSGSAGALSVMQIDASGALSPTDHLMDDLNSRFGGVQAVDVIEFEGRWYVVAGGGDDGISLFSLMPGGTLLHVDTIADSVTTGLSDVSGLTLAQSNGALHVFVASNADVGLTHLTFDLADQGHTLQADSAGGVLNGGWKDDIMVGGSGADSLIGGSGNDTLVDGAGEDDLAGGAGADTFVLTFDGVHDVISDFNQNVDHLDLSFWPFLYDLASLSITQLSNGVRISHRGEILDVLGENGASLNPDTVRSMILDGPSRSGPLTYDTGGDTGGDGGGEDTVDDSGGSDLYNTMEGTTDADELLGTSISDMLIGYEGNDTIRGNDDADTLVGGMGEDKLYGGGGDDSMRGGDDNDSLFGEAGEDYIEGGDGNDSIVGGGGDNKLFGQRGDDTLIGGSQNDRLNGGGGSDFLSGSKGEDWFRGGNGNETMWGGSGNDTMFGNADNDVLHSGSGDDRLNGGGGDDSLRGGTGNDYLKGGEGADTFIFEKGMGSDEILSYERDYDILQLDSDLLNGQTTGAQVLAAYGSVEGSNVVLDFGDGDMITLLWANSLVGISDGISII